MRVFVLRMANNFLEWEGLVSSLRARESNRLLREEITITEGSESRRRVENDSCHVRSGISPLPSHRRN
ncbi:hypothetical protein Tco_0941967 [Tanacetum coccineum]|uniref:Uncharacterized protein n=1 Tax=Tanacetum coccineum TaxID=301880 RepID=A0ABQ5DSE7_9ASTR